jgi:hypothetical protein
MRQGVGWEGGEVKRRIIETPSNFHSGSNLMRDMAKWGDECETGVGRWGAGVLSDMTHDRRDHRHTIRCRHFNYHATGSFL